MTDLTTIAREIVDCNFWRASKIARARGTDYTGPSGADVVDWLSELIPEIETALQAAGGAIRYDVGAFDPQTGEALRVVKNVDLSCVEIVITALEKKYADAEIDYREHEPEEG